MHILINKKYLTYNRYKAKCALGKRGIGYKKKEGDLITQKDQYRIKYLLYRRDRIKKIKTKLTRLSINKNMGWCNDSKSKNYNQLVKLPFKFNHEKLYRRDNIYDLILVLNFNMNPIKKNKGSAIFIHIAKKKYNKTEGCVAINKKMFLRIITKITRKTLVKISDQK